MTGADMDHEPMAIRVIRAGAAWEMATRGSAAPPTCSPSAVPIWMEAKRKARRPEGEKTVERGRVVGTAPGVLVCTTRVS